MRFQGSPSRPRRLRRSRAARSGRSDDGRRGTLAVARTAGESASWAPAGWGASTAGSPSPSDVSADLGEVAGREALVVSSGVKSLLDVPATVEVLETLGVPVLGWRVDTLPRFYAADGGPPSRPASSRPRRPRRSRARALGARRRHAPARPTARREPRRGRSDRGGRRAGASRGVEGQAVTPFVLPFLHERSNGRTLAVNRELIAAFGPRRRDRGRGGGAEPLGAGRRPACTSRAMSWRRLVLGEGTSHVRRRSSTSWGRRERGSARTSPMR